MARQSKKRAYEDARTQSEAAALCVADIEIGRAHV